MRNIFKVLCLSVSMIMISSLTFSHSSWIRLAREDKNSKSILVMIAHGHKFPEGGHKLQPEFVKVYEIDGKGNKTQFLLNETVNSLSGSFKKDVQKGGRFCFVYDRGVMSKTTRGWKQGGKDVHPEALQRMRSLVSGCGLIGMDLKETSPMGFPVELLLVKFDKDVTLHLLKDSKPYAGADIMVQLPGKEEKLAGKTDAKGEIKIALPARKGEMLFAAEFRINHPAGSDLDVENFNATLYLNLE